jgi:3-dehydroquinate synthase
MLNSEIQVNINNKKSYPIFVDNDDISALEEKIFSQTKANKALIVISQKVEKLYGEKLNFKNCQKIVIKDGEKYKNFKTYQKIMKAAFNLKLERKDAIIAIGGGVIGDMAGFAASSYLRGIDLIQVPTTLLACVDSSVGGKVGINNEFGKNLVGAFYQPKAVFCNVNFLPTIDLKQLKTGLAEIIKYAFIEKSCLTAGMQSDSERSNVKYFHLFDFLMANPDKIYDKNINTFSEIIKICLNLKIAVITKDEKENDLRRILNFGHTLAHAIEKITNYRKYTHGEAVYLGMKFAVALSAKRNYINDETKCKMISLLDRYVIVKKFPKFNIKKLINLMHADKKVENGKINFVLSTNYDTVWCFNDITNDEIKEVYKNLTK